MLNSQRRINYETSLQKKNEASKHVYEKLKMSYLINFSCLLPTWKNHRSHLAWGELYRRRESNVHFLKKYLIFHLEVLHTVTGDER